jgi:hypothetical protein
VSVPIANTLAVTDDPLNGVSVWGDRVQDAWMAEHGGVPGEVWSQQHNKPTDLMSSIMPCVILSCVISKPDIWQAPRANPKV